MVKTGPSSLPKNREVWEKIRISYTLLGPCCKGINGSDPEVEKFPNIMSKSNKGGSVSTESEKPRNKSSSQIIIKVDDIHSKMPSNDRMPVEYYVEEFKIAFDELVACEERRRKWSEKKDNSPNPFKIKINDVLRKKIRKRNNHTPRLQKNIWQNSEKKRKISWIENGREGKWRTNS